MPIRYFDAWNLRYIWFGPLPLFNKERLRQVRQQNPRVKISLTISREIITDEELASIDRFCKRNQIHLVMIENLKQEVLASGTPVEKKLFELIEEELHNSHGNKAAASDILRAHTYFWLDEESAGSGVYLDLDSTVMPPKKQWQKLEEAHPYLVPFNSIYGHRSFFFANDVIILTTLNKKLNLPSQKINIQNDLHLVQKSILSSYENPLEKIEFTVIQRSIFTSQLKKETIFEIRKKIAEASFSDWVTLEFQRYKEHFARQKIYTRHEQEKFITYTFDPENPEPKIAKTNSDYSARYLNNKVYYDIFIPKIKEAFENYDIKMKQFAYGNRDQSELSETDTVKAYYSILKSELYQKSVSEVSGVHNFVNPKTIPKEKHLLSIQHHKLGINYIGQLGIGESFAYTENTMEPDLSWTDYGALELLEKSKSAAINIFKKNGLTASGLRAWLKNKKNEKPFKIKLWAPEYHHLTVSPPALAFRVENGAQKSGDVKSITVRGEHILAPVL